MRIEKLEDMVIWQDSRMLVVEIYSSFKNCRDYGFKDQLQRAVISVMNNIAEGFERKGDKEFKRFLHIAKGSCGEVKSMIYAAVDLGYIDKNSFKMLYERADCISRKTAALANKLNY